jgi:hypothetical protein
MAILKKRISSKSGARITNTGIKFRFSNAISVKSEKKLKKRKFYFEGKNQK